LIRVFAASGGLLNGNIALICGGYKQSNPIERLDHCFAITDNAVEAKEKLTNPRNWAASVVLNGDTLWLTGGQIYDSGSTETSEFVHLTGTKPGPDLPLNGHSYCLVSLNETTVLLIGGRLANGTMGSKATFYYNNDQQTWTEGPSLITGRNEHSCAQFKSPQHGHTDTVIVTGGFNGEFLASTEFLNLDSNSWTLGS
jgi:hypothetical protein